MDFIYQAENNIYQKDLNDFLKLAEELQLKGLAVSTENILVEQAIKNTNQYESSIKEPQYFQVPIDIRYESFSDSLSVLAIDSDKKVVHEKILSMMEKITDGEHKLKCSVYGKAQKYKIDMIRHMESHLEGVVHTCTQCGKVSNTSSALKMHVKNHHTNSK